MSKWPNAWQVSALVKFVWKRQKSEPYGLGPISMYL